MKKTITLIITSLICQLAIAQYAPDWDSSLGGQLYNEVVDIGYDDSGNVYVLGHKVNTNQDIVLVKCTDVGCSTIATYSKTEDVTAYKLEVDGATGDCYIVGEIFDNGSITQTDAIAIKYNSSGTLQWEDRYDSYPTVSSTDAFSYYDAVLNNNILYITGLGYGGIAAQDNMLIVKYTSNGSRTVRNYDNSFGHTVGHKLIVDGSTIYLGALDQLNNNFEYYSIPTSFLNSTTVTLIKSRSTTWTSIDGMAKGTNFIAFMSDIGVSTEVYSHSINNTNNVIKSYIDSEITNPSALILNVNDDRIVVSGDELVSEYRLAISIYYNGSRIFHSQLEPTPGSNVHNGKSSYAKGLFIDNNGDYAIPGKLTLDTNPNDGNTALSSYAGFVSFDTNGNQTGFHVYETTTNVAQGVLNPTTGGVVIAGARAWVFSDQSDAFYWVGGSGNVTDYANHWATTSGGTTFQTKEPDSNSIVTFDSNSFTSTGQTITFPLAFSCHDFLAKDATNSPTFSKDVGVIVISGSASFNSSIDYQLGGLTFFSTESETIDFGGLVANASGNFPSSIDFNNSGSFEFISDATISNYNIYISNNSSLTIGSGVTLISKDYLEISTGTTLINSGTLIIDSGADLINETGSSISGNDLIFKRKTTFGISEGKYSIVGSPIATASTSSLGDIVYSYDESQTFIGNEGLDRFISVSSPETMTAGKGYFSANTGTISVAGMPNNGTVNVPLSFSGSVGAEGDYDGFNLVSNPYSAAMSVSDLLDANGSAGTGAIEDMIYIWVDGGSNAGRRSSNDYMTVNAVGSVGGNSTRSADYNDYLGSFQGFFVKATGAGQTLSFAETMRLKGKNSDVNFFRTENEEMFKIRISLENETLRSETLIGFLEDASLGYDTRYDAKNLLAANTLNIATLIDNEAYSIQGRPLTYDADIIALNFDTETEGAHQLIFDFESMPSNQTVSLYDAYTSKTIDLNEVSTYEFSSKSGSFTDRFQILTGANTITAIDELMNVAVDYTFSPNGVNIKSATPLQSISIYDFQGRVIDRMTFGSQEKERFFEIKNHQEKLIIIRAIDIYGKVDVQKFNIK